MTETRRREWTGVLLRERDRRYRLRWARPTNADELEEWYLEKMREALARLFAEPGWYPEPDCEESRILEEVDAWMAGQGCQLSEPDELVDIDLEQVKLELREMGYLVDGRHE